MKKIVLFVHQGAEMYGSDKVLLNLAIGVKTSPFQPVVLIPFDGPLVEELRREGIETHIVAVTKVTRALFSIKGLLSLPTSLIRSARAMSKAINGRKVALVHSNTLAVLSGAVWATLHRIPHIWHVHEILLTPALIRHAYPFVLRFMAQRVISNSSLTTQWLVGEQPRLAPRVVTIWNGITRNISPDSAQTAELRSEVCVNQGQVSHDCLIVALVGRINHMKGHLLLVEAATLLWQRGYRHIKYLVVGSYFQQQQHFLDQLKTAIAQSPIADDFVLRGFTDSIWNVWDACDIAIVPSTEPEAFGLVAAEAMCAGKPVIAAAHGGLLDVVEDNVTGLLVPPRDAVAFAEALARLADHPQLRAELGSAGKIRQQQLFSLNSQIGKTIDLYQSMVGEGQA